ncbi:YoaK family protein [Streptomyces morookaense]|uniref:YoaK family protein n=1 Tax=Streptomyces morookaense TaxID=1970 RepID=UPI0033CB0E36
MTARPSWQPTLLMALTVVSGIVDAVSYLGLGHVFTANMTGNVVVLGFAAGGAPGFSAAGSLVSLAGFGAGAVLAGRFANALAAHPARWRTGWALLAEAVLMAGAAAAAGASRYAGIGVLAVAMGVRNATVRRMAVPDMTTTVLTMALTGLASESRLAGGRGPRSLRRGGAALAMAAGACAGAALVLRHGAAPPLWATAACVGVLAGACLAPAPWNRPPTPARPPA